MKRIIPIIILLWMHVAGFAQVSITQRDSIYTIENPHFCIRVESAGGARIMSWTLKPSGREIIALWKGTYELGGALDDRAFFTAMRYDAAIMHPGPETATLRLEAKHPSGLSVLKILTVRRDSPALEIYYEFRNATQTPQRLFVRNFFLPGHKPQDENHLYWVNAAATPEQKLIAGRTDAHGYYPPAVPAFSALWDKSTGDGILAFAPGADKFYFWRDSREFPTFEWIYADVPPGKMLQAGVVLITVSEQSTPPDWEALIRKHGTRIRSAVLRPLEGWVDEVTKFNVTDAERQRGFWLSIGADDYKQRLPERLPLDLPLDDNRYVSVTLNILKDFEAPVRVKIPQKYQQCIEAFWQSDGPDRRELLPLSEKHVAFKSGAKEVLWLHISSKDLRPGPQEIPVELAVGEHTLPIRLSLHIWPVVLDHKRPFHVRGYYGGFTVLTAGYEVTEKGLRHLELMLKAFAAIGGDVVDWTCAWNRILANTKIADTGENLTEVAKSDPNRIALNNLPRLDFSYFGPWFDMAKRYGVNRLETYMGYPTDSRIQWLLLDSAVGKGRVKVGTPEAERVIVWFYTEMKRYFESIGFEGLFCKIADEISPEHIPSYIAAAKLARQAGWRPFTTITGMIPRTAEHIRSMDPYCDQWQLGFGSKDIFLALTQKKYVTEDQRFELKCTWGAYHNGGAQATWGAKIFGEEGATRLDPGTVERIELLEDGVPLRIKGGSPWGNTERGVVFTSGALKEYLYISPREGEPKEHKYELRIIVRRESPQGKPLVTIDATDELWCYGGGSSPFRGSYHNAWVYPMMTLHHGFRGYGLWAFYHWQKTERIVWVDEDARRLTISPAWCGYRDGWRDALIYHQLIRQRGRGEYEKLVGESEDALLRVSPRTTEVYKFSTIHNAADPVAMNKARREALKQLAAP